VLGTGEGSSESESEEERRRSKSSTARRWSASASEAVDDVGEEGRKVSRSSSCRGGGCWDAIAGDDDDIGISGALVLGSVWFRREVPVLRMK
jgi:hypothetical protein